MSGLLARIRPDRDGLVDVAAAGVLTALALVGFRTGFDGPAWVGAAAAGTGLGLLVAWLGSALRWPAAGTLAGLVVGYLLLGGPFAVRTGLLGGVLPTPATFGALASAAVHGWKRFLTTAPPVDAQVDLLAVPFLTGLVGAAVILTVARRWTHPYAVGVPVLGLVASSILLGTLEPASLLAQGLLVLLALLAWWVHRAGRRRPVVAGPTVSSGRRGRVVVGVGLLLVTVGAAWFGGPRLPGANPEGRTVARSALVPPLDVTTFPSPLAGFRKYTEPNPAHLYDQPLLVVGGLPAGTPLRFATLDGYDRSVWGTGRDPATGQPSSVFRQVGARIATPEAGRPTTYTVSVPQGGYRDVWLPTVGTTTGVSFRGDRAAGLAARLWLDSETGTAVVPAGLRSGDAYTATALLDPAPADLPATLELASGSLTPDLELAFLAPRVDAWTAGTSDSWQQVRAVAAALRTGGAYTDGGTANSDERFYLAGHGEGRLARFVAARQLAGDDEQYAATLALAANRLDVPARVVLGALVPADGTVKGRDVHAWVEVQTADGRWQPLLPATFLPDRNVKPNRLLSETTEHKVGVQVPPPAGQNPPSVLQGPDQAQNATNLKRPPARGLTLDAVPVWVRWLLGVGLVLALLYTALRGATGWARRRAARRGAPSTRVARAWADLLVRLRALGYRAPTRATRLEQAAALEPVGLEPLAREADGLVFGPDDPPDAEVAAYWAQAAQLERSARAGVSRWRRVRAQVDPRPLLALLTSH